MKEPVTDCYGHSFEKHALQEWVNHHNVSPVNRKPYPTWFKVSELPVNYSLKLLCDNERNEKSIQKLIYGLSHGQDTQAKECATKAVLDLSHSNDILQKRRFCEAGGVKALLALTHLINVSIQVNTICILMNFGLDDIELDLACVDFLSGLLNTDYPYRHLATKALYSVIHNNREMQNRVIESGGLLRLCNLFDDTYARETVRSLASLNPIEWKLDPDDKTIETLLSYVKIGDQLASLTFLRISVSVKDPRRMFRQASETGAIEMLVTQAERTKIPSVQRWLCHHINGIHL